MPLPPKYDGNINIIFAFSTKDKDQRENLEKHLKNLKKEDVNIQFYSQEIDNNVIDFLYEANIIGLLISPDFPDLNSSWEQNIVNQAMRKHTDKGVRVIPIYLSSIYSHGEPYAELQSLPSKNRPVDSGSWKNQNEAFYDIAKNIRDTIEKIRIEIGQQQKYHNKLERYRKLRFDLINKKNTLTNEIEKELNDLTNYLGSECQDIKEINSAIQRCLHRRKIRKQAIKCLFPLVTIIFAIFLTSKILRLLTVPISQRPTASPSKSNHNPAIITDEVSDGWIFIGRVKKTVEPIAFGDSLISGSQFIDLLVIPSINSEVTVIKNVKLRNNLPQAPDFDPKEQEELGLLKSGEKVMITGVKYFTDPNSTPPVIKVWAKVRRCGGDCN